MKREKGVTRACMKVVSHDGIKNTNKDKWNKLYKLE
jgi:hypothetical protein